MGAFAKDFGIVENLLHVILIAGALKDAKGVKEDQVAAVAFMRADLALAGWHSFKEILKK